LHQVLKKQFIAECPKVPSSEGEIGGERGKKRGRKRDIGKCANN